jgi:hypothetical protein
MPAIAFKAVRIGLLFLLLLFIMSVELRKESVL